MESQTIGYGRPVVDEDDIAAVARVLRTDSLTGGPALDLFEAGLAGECGAAEVVAVNNGTSALRLLYRAVGVGPGKRVGIPAITFIATASQAMVLGAEVVLLDVDPQTLLLTPEILDACREPLDYVVAVHMAGRLCDMRGLAEIAARRGITLLEDAAHAFGSRWDDGRRAGDCTWSRGAIFSFHPVKNITTGEGGAIAIGDPELACRLRRLRHHGIERQQLVGDLAGQDRGAPWYHEFHELGGNERLSDIQAALGLSQLRKLESFRSARQRVYDAYRRALLGTPGFVLPPTPAGQTPFWHLFQLQLGPERPRRELFERAQRAGFALQVHYIPLHRQPLMKNVARASALGGADAAYRGLVSLPCFPGFSNIQRLRLLDALCGASLGVPAWS